MIYNRMSACDPKPTFISLLFDIEQSERANTLRFGKVILMLHRLLRKRVAWI